MEALTLAWSLFGGWLAWIILMVIGFGLLVVVHELGHFLAAKWVGIRVEEFAIGFGKRLWAFRKGETEYRLNILPLGGYVKMTGQEDFQTKDQESPDPRAYNNRPISARMCVISAGVVMNVILAALLFVIVFMVGWRFTPAVVGDVQAGFPAATVVLPGGRGVGLRPGDVIEAIDGEAISKYGTLARTAILSDEDQTFRLTIARPRGDGTVDRFDVIMGTRGLDTVTGAKRFAFGISGARDRVVEKRFNDMRKRMLLDTEGTDVLAAADTIVGFGDQVISDGWQIAQAEEALTFTDRFPGLIDGGRLSPVPVVVERTDGSRATIYVNPQLRWSWAHQVAFAKAVDAAEAADDDRPDPEPFGVLGLRPRVRVSFIGEDSPADKGGVKVGDIIVAYGDPPRLCSHENLPETSAEYVDEDAPLVLIRNGERIDAVQVRPKKGTRYRNGEAQTIGRIGIIGIPDDLHPIVAEVAPDSPLVGLVPIGATLLKVSAAEAPASRPASRSASRPAMPDSPVRTWSELIVALKRFQDGEVSHVTLHFRHPTGKLGQATVELTAERFDPAHYALTTGVQDALGNLKGPLIQTLNPFKATWWGVRETGDFIMQVYATLRQLITGRVSPKLLSGPVGIFRIGVMAGQSGGVLWLVYLLAIISANLAVINFLPLPIVDGGHMVFLIIEKVRKKPLSVRIQNAVQIAGLVMLAAVFILITYNDIAQWIRSSW